MSGRPIPVPAAPKSCVRVGVRVRGTVQGVGFRPSVYRLATVAGLSGLVRNDSDGVWIEIEGDPGTVGAFPERLRHDAPALSRIESVDVVELAPRGDAEFRVVTSARSAAATAAIPADAATCTACLSELFDTADRRFGYPFINCTDCGPRYTIVRDVPYDRAATTMDPFEMCADCRAEYEDPGSRRFHAEPNACAVCGPRLELVRPGSPPLFASDALRGAAHDLRGGRIVAIKGLGGFLLACDASRGDAVAELRRRKRRPFKPLAVMARDLETASRIVALSPAAVRILRSPAAPIVLVTARDTDAVAREVAPRLTELGIQLPYTPLHHLLLATGPPVLVMTSGNFSEEPIARENYEAVAKLSGIADAFLLHDRDIHTRADDSVVRFTSGALQPIRRSRGFAPDPIALGFESDPVLAVGAELKNVVALTRGAEAYLSPHIGDLQNLETFAFFEEMIEKLERLLDVRPAAVAHDLHPDYLSTRWALACGLPRIPVQHHHAHVAACLAEHAREGPVIGVAFDGTGCGPGGEIWGGEILLASLSGYRRAGHLRPIALPGGEAAIRQPWRVAAAAAADAGIPVDCVPGIDPARLARVVKLLETRVATPLATGAGRWFDAISALLGIRSVITYEGQAAVELEAIADPGECDPFPFHCVKESGGFEIDLRPTVGAVDAAVRGGVPVGEIAARFHETLARAVAVSCVRVRDVHRVDAVALSGGCFQNRRLSERAEALLSAEGFEVLVHRKTPPNDGGVALGQAAVAARRLARKEG